MTFSNRLIIPEYKIELLNKSKKIINTIENFDKFEGLENVFKEDIMSDVSKKDVKSSAKKTKKTKVIKKKAKKLRTLWVRRKKSGQQSRHSPPSPRSLHGRPQAPLAYLLSSQPSP